MVDLITYVTVNFNYFAGLGLSLLLALACFILYNRTANKGFIAILVGIFVSIGWTCIYLFVLEGVYFIENLYNSGMPHADISIAIMISGGIGLAVSVIQTLTLLIGLIFIANELPKKSYDSIY